MGQITIYLDEKLEKEMETAVKASRLSANEWIANLIREEVAAEWSQDVIELAGSWGDDFPSLSEIRRIQLHRASSLKETESWM